MEKEKSVKDIEKEERDKYLKEMIKIKYEQKLQKAKKGGIFRQWLENR